MRYYDKPCDVSLAHYFQLSLCLSLCMTSLNNILRVCCSRAGLHSRLGLALAQCAPGAVLVVYGLSLLHRAKTCPATAPELYYPLAIYIRFQAVYLVVIVVFGAATMT